MIKITHSFTGYPDDVEPRHFDAGDTPSDLSADYTALLIEKGLAADDRIPAGAKSPALPPVSPTTKTEE